jgi:hypothetical protein
MVHNLVYRKPKAPACAEGRQVGERSEHFFNETNSALRIAYCVKAKYASCGIFHTAVNQTFLKNEPSPKNKLIWILTHFLSLVNKKFRMD